MDQPLDLFKHLRIVFLTLCYTATGEIPTLFLYHKREKVPLLGGASPYSPLQEVPPPPSSRGRSWSWPLTGMINKSAHLKGATSRFVHLEKFSLNFSSL